MFLRLLIKIGRKIHLSKERWKHYFKHKESSTKFLKVIVKYLNGYGFVITAYFVRNIS